MMKIFVSHSSKDKDFVRRLCADLHNIGYPNWLDELQIQVGDSIPELIHQAIASACRIIVVLSSNSITSPWVKREINSAYFDVVDGKKKLLPVLIEDVKIPDMLRDLKYADFRTSYEEGFKQLVKSLPNTKTSTRTRQKSVKELSYEQRKYSLLSEEQRIKIIEELMKEWYPSTLTQDNYHLLGWLETYLPVEGKRSIKKMIQNNIKLVEANLPFTSYTIEGWR